MRIRVTEDHIRKGIAGYCSVCPLALACEDAGLVRPMVRVVVVRFGPDENRQSIRLPAVAKKFIRNFDRGYVVHPFEFDLKVPEEHA
jgi:hypothetical protein